MPTATETADRLYENRRLLAANPNYSEADTVAHLIDPALEYLGYPATHQLRENQIDKNRPDIVLWTMPYALRGSAPANAILEAKPLGHDLNGSGRPRAQRPKEQIRRYVTGYAHSRPGTFGILTDGNIWHLIRRGADGAHRINTPLVQEWRIFDDGPAQTALCLREIDAILKGAGAVADTPAPGRTRRKPDNADARAICQAIAEGQEPADILRRITGQPDCQTTLLGQAQLQGKAQQAEAHYWQTYAYAAAGKIRADQADTSHESVCIAVIRAADAETADDAALFREDAAIAAATFAKTAPLKMSVALMIQPDADGAASAARLAVHYQGHTGMTTEFNPHTPSPQTLKTVQRIYDLLRSGRPVMAKALADAVAARGVRDAFYQQVAAGWTLRQQRRAKGSAARRQGYREAVLRHLIRVIFAWILKEDGKLPPEAFDEAFARREAPGRYHADILSFLFHERLNRPAGDRNPHPNASIDRALDDARFLNGSLFARHRDDDLLALDDADYFGTDASAPGLFTILSEYDWTASEHTPHSSDQTIDPEVLSNLFENLIAATRFGAEVPDRMPDGVYYTPADVATEMVKDALTEAVIDHAPAGWTRADLRNLFGSADDLPPAASDAERHRLGDRIRALTIYDPAVGSGEFPFLCALAIKGALVKLGAFDSQGQSPDDNGAALTRDIIARQLFAQDINPMAVQVTRLRLFIAIIAAENAPDTSTDAAGAGAIPPPPLPNLEAKIVCADTLATVADPDWSPFGAGTLQAGVAQVNTALAQVATIREQWQSAHDEPSKLALRQQDDAARRALRAALRGRMSNPETAAFADHPLLAPDAPPAQTDPRLLFYRPDRRGFDIVIGNPPYESVNKDLQAPRNANRAERQVWDDRRKARRRHLVTEKRYRTTAGNDLYNLVAEAALTLAKPDGGVVTLVAPLSLCFGQDQAPLRRLFEERCRRISLRCQDNRPDKVFHDSPVAHAESRVRAAVITATTGPGAPVIDLSDANRWRKSERHEYLSSRPAGVIRGQDSAVDPRIDGQWERLPTPAIQALIAAMRAAPTKIRDLQPTAGASAGDCALSFPPTAMYFITAAPAGRLQRREKLLPIASAENLELAIAAANTHAAYAWWKVFGDAFDINPHEIATIAIPQAWIGDDTTNRRVRQLAGQLLAAINPTNIRRIKTGTGGAVQDSLNFHDCAPAVIAQLDALYLSALPLPRQPQLLPQLHTLRSDSTWRLGAAG